jgi:S-layer family protein
MTRTRGLALWVWVVVLAAGSAAVFAQTASQSGAPGSPVTPQPKAPQTFGTGVTTYVQVPVSSFLPFDSGRAYTTTGFGVFNMGRYATANPSDFNAPVQLPSGALITYLELDYCDTAGNSNHVYGTFVNCDWTGQTCTNYPTTGTSDAGWLTSADGATGCSNVHIDMTPFNLTVDNYLTHYHLDAETYAIDGTNAITGMLVGYKLQVSPAPASATFPDVPTSDFGFQYVEALVASGITGGCGGGLYCPDGPVTRRQMAIFIAKALGLQWNH